MRYRLDSGEVISVRVDRLTPEKVRAIPGITAHDRIGLLALIVRREVRAIRRMLASAE